jgi:hypothetical protein
MSPAAFEQFGYAVIILASGIWIQYHDVSPGSSTRTTGVKILEAPIMPLVLGTSPWFVPVVPRLGLVGSGAREISALRPATTAPGKPLVAGSTVRRMHVL